MRYLELTLFRYFAFEFIAVFHFGECSCMREARQNDHDSGLLIYYDTFASKP
jgi:hypothetical protein